MKPLHRQALWLFLIVLAATGLAQDKPNQVSLSLQDCIAQTIQNNLGVAIQILNPQLSAAAVTRAEEKFLPTVTFGVTQQYSDQPSYSFLDAQGNLTDKTGSFTFLQATESLPFGGTLNLALTGNKSDSNRSFQTINPRYGTTLRFSLTQPLLRNFGLKISRYNILVARNNLNVSDYQLKQSLMDTVYQVESAYWNLVYSIENLKVRDQSLNLAKDLLDMNKRMVEVGTLAPMEILAAQAEVATREADLIQAQTQVESASDQLKVLINMPEEQQKAVGTIIPLDSPSFEEHTVNLDEALVTALQFRPDLEATKIGIETQRLNLSYTKNQMLPDLNLSASYWSPGISGTPVDPDTGLPTGSPQGIGDSFSQTFHFKYTNWSVGLSLSIPTSNIFTRASYTQAKLTLQQAVLGLENQRQQVFLEIKNAIRSVDANFKRIAAYKVARELAEQKMAAEQEKFRVGQSTNFTVLTYQRDLANARISELNSVIAYNVSLAALDRSLGVSLRDKNIKLSDYVSQL